MITQSDKIGPQMGQFLAFCLLVIVWSVSLFVAGASYDSYKSDCVNELLYTQGGEPVIVCVENK